MASSAVYRIQKLCTLWTHEPSFSSEEIVFNADRFTELNLLPGSLAQVIPILQGTSVRDFVRHIPSKRKKVAVFQHDGDSRTDSTARRNRGGISTITLDENGIPVVGGKEIDEQRAYIFVARDASPEMKSKYPNLQVIKSTPWRVLELLTHVPDLYRFFGG
jgi:hypothetical protein